MFGALFPFLRSAHPSIHPHPFHNILTTFIYFPYFYICSPLFIKFNLIVSKSTFIHFHPCFSNFTHFHPSCISWEDRSGKLGFGGIFAAAAVLDQTSSDTVWPRWIRYVLDHDVDDDDDDDVVDDDYDDDDDDYDDDDDDNDVFHTKLVLTLSNPIGYVSSYLRVGNLWNTLLASLVDIANIIGIWILNSKFLPSYIFLQNLKAVQVLVLELQQSGPSSDHPNFAPIHGVLDSSHNKFNPLDLLSCSNPIYLLKSTPIQSRRLLAQASRVRPTKQASWVSWHILPVGRTTTSTISPTHRHHHHHLHHHNHQQPTKSPHSSSATWPIQLKFPGLQVHGQRGAFDLEENTSWKVKLE